MKRKKRRPELTGTLSKHKRGFGFVRPEDGTGDVYISARGMGGAMDGDLVAVELVPEAPGEGSREGRVRKILKRNTQEVAGTFEKSKKFGFVIPDGKKGGEDIFVRRKDFSGAQRGDKVLVRITRYSDGENSAEGKVVEIISRSGQAGGDIKALARSRGLRETFPSRANAEAKAVSRQEISSQECENRRDLRHKNIFTIDGADSKDFDDAVSVELLSGGNYLLGVHIADVSHYVAEDGYLDREALKRGNSVYLLDQVIPMLPRGLSNGICSLNPDVDRLTLSVEMEITPQGEVAAHDIFESVIHSKARLVYSDVSDMLEKKDTALMKKHRDVFEDLLIMDKLAGILRRKRKERGSLDFDFDEAFIRLDAKGAPVSVDIAERRAANRMIEEFMLLANQTVAEHFFWLEIPFVYRVHEAPSLLKMEELRNFLRGLGLSVRGTAGNVHPRALNEILKSVQGKSCENVVNTVMLRCMQKACYKTECEGHFGLALKYYCHFTSPIRRYADLIVHRIVKAQLHGQMSMRAAAKFEEKTAEAAEIASMTERTAVELEREVEKLKKAEFMQGRIGACYDAVISGVSGFGIYVQLENTVEGMIRLDSLTDDYYICEPRQYRVIGERTGKVYGLGQQVRVQVESVSVENREINFILAQQARRR